MVPRDILSCTEIFALSTDATASQAQLCGPVRLFLQYMRRPQIAKRLLLVGKRIKDKFVVLWMPSGRFVRRLDIRYPFTLPAIARTRYGNSGWPATSLVLLLHVVLSSFCGSSVSCVSGNVPSLQYNRKPTCSHPSGHLQSGHRSKSQKMEACHSGR